MSTIRKNKLPCKKNNNNALGSLAFQHYCTLLKVVLAPGPSIGVGASLGTVVGWGSLTDRRVAFAVLVTSWNGLDLGFVEGKLTTLSWLEMFVYASMGLFYFALPCIYLRMHFNRICIGNVFWLNRFLFMRLASFVCFWFCGTSHVGNLSLPLFFTHSVVSKPWAFRVWLNACCVQDVTAIAVYWFQYHNWLPCLVFVLLNTANCQLRWVAFSANRKVNYKPWNFRHVSFCRNGACDFLSILLECHHNYII